MDKAEIIRFGGHDWRVLDVQNGRALLLSDKIIEKKPYHNEYEYITWETCELRKYLNGEFYDKFSEAEKSMITQTTVANDDNLWFGISGGNATDDKIFLLSLEEADTYFGDSGDYQNMKRVNWDSVDKKFVAHDYGYYLSNDYDKDRVAEFENNKDKWNWWWLRSLGRDYDFAAYVHERGCVYVVGELICGDWDGFEGGGVRPAMWVNIW
ncbi:MAG: DUF6273 domain-containing protein [Eubacteriaceae bacterium]|nr:DUF6273 domain-containing protein [Eubacteriaceae bacterium]